MRNLAFSIAILICFYCLVGDASHGQEKPTAAPAIFIVAVKGEYPGDRPFTIVSAETLRRRKNDYPELLREAVWRADTLTPGREPGNKNDWPKNLVKLFLKELKEAPALTEKLAALPKLRLASGSDVMERTRPVLAGGRDNDAPPASRSGALPRANDQSPSRDQLMRAILSAHTGVGTRFYDALYLTLTERLNKVQGRKAILLFTDGVDNMSKFADWKTVIARRPARAGNNPSEKDDGEDTD